MNGTQNQVILDEASDYLNDQRPLHAIQLLMRLIEDDPSCADAYLQLAEIYIGLKKYDAAEKILLDGFNKLPANLRIAFAIGSLYYSVGDFKKSLPYLRLVSSWKNPGVHLAMATILLEEGDFKTAIAEAKQVLKINPKYPDANGILGKIYLKQNSLTEAIKYLNRELRINEGSLEFRLELATAYYLLGDLNSALEEFSLLVDTDPDFFPGWLMCGKILFEQERYAEAEFYLTRAFSINPRSDELKQIMANLYNATGELKAARGFFDEVAKKDSIIEDDLSIIDRISGSNKENRHN
ncbi:MAG: tetratricopeptide repeat protein [Candidatus Kryptoniota bacterium]